MKIAIIGPGAMPIPPTGWGACESLIWDYYITLTDLNYEVEIINEPQANVIINKTNQFNPDFVHIQYDDWYWLYDKFNCKNVLLTTHYAYLDQPQKHGGYSNIFHGIVESKKLKLFCLSQSIIQTYLQHGVAPERLFHIPNGVNFEAFQFEKIGCDRSIYLAKIDYRKRQSLFEGIDKLYFAGNIADANYKKTNYLGEWNKNQLHSELTKFGNLVLLSDGEAHSLVLMEAMACGLGIVISEFAVANLDLSKEFITVIPEAKVTDIKFVEEQIKLNREKSLTMREEIRMYAIENFAWEQIVNKFYIPNLLKLKNYESYI